MQSIHNKNWMRFFGVLSFFAFVVVLMISFSCKEHDRFQRGDEFVNQHTGEVMVIVSGERDGQYILYTTTDAWSYSLDKDATHKWWDDNKQWLDCYRHGIRLPE